MAFPELVWTMKYLFSFLTARGLIKFEQLQISAKCLLLENDFVEKWEERTLKAKLKDFS